MILVRVVRIHAEYEEEIGMYADCGLALSVFKVCERNEWKSDCAIVAYLIDTKEVELEGHLTEEVCSYPEELEERLLQKKAITAR